MPPLSLLTLDVRHEHDVVLARQRTRQIAELLGFDAQDQTRIATAVSELARNAYEYARGGRVRFAVEELAEAATSRRATPRQTFIVRVVDEGPGIADLDAVLSGRYVSPTGMGLGLIGARRLSDRFHVQSAPGRGTTVEIGRGLPNGRSIAPIDASRIADTLAQKAPSSVLEEVQRQNQELLHALDDLRTRQAEVERLNAEQERLNVELAETNRGVLALYAELDDRAQDLQRASEYKSRFLSDVSHELRTPLTSVLNMTRILLDHTDGDLSSEQDHQVRIIRKAVDSLMEMVSDLLDLAKIEAGRTTMRQSTFPVSELFAALRGLFRPMLSGDAVALTFEAPDDLPLLETDEQRLAQVLRNFISNAIKFTEHGAIHVTAAAETADASQLRFAVRDTGIGIAASDHGRIFQDFAQVDGPIQRRVRGTGLGLPLSKKLTTLLGGRLELESEPGVGSTFAIVIPRVLPAEVEQGEPARSLSHTVVP